MFTDQFPQLCVESHNTDAQEDRQDQEDGWAAGFQKIFLNISSQNIQGYWNVQYKDLEP